MYFPTIIAMVLLTLAQFSVAGFLKVARDVEVGVENMFDGLMARQQSIVTVTITYIPSYCTSVVLPATTISTTATITPSSTVVGPNIMPTEFTSSTTVAVSTPATFAPTTTPSSTAAAVVGSSSAVTNSTTATSTKATTTVAVTSTVTAPATSSSAAAIASAGVRAMVNSFLGTVVVAMTLLYAGLEFFGV